MSNQAAYNKTHFFLDELDADVEDPLSSIIFRIMLHGGYFEYWKAGLVVVVYVQRPRSKLLECLVNLIGIMNAAISDQMKDCRVILEAIKRVGSD
nr:hypothetical protein [Tanacetum cinerariifolium]